MGLRAITLGHTYPDVVEAAYRQMLLGNNFTRPATIEVECAEALLSWVPGAEMVKFAKDGSRVTTAAITLARSYTGRDMVAICGDHPFFSYNEWFIGSTPMSAGIPQVIKDLTVKFNFNDIYQQGERLRQGINQAIAANELQDYFQVVGIPCNLVYVTRDQNKQASQAFRTLFMQETIKRGLILPSLVVSFSHSNQDIDITIDAISESLKIYRKALEYGIDDYLIGRPVKPVFRKYC